MRFADKVCVVTGAAKGIGLATAQRLAAEGAHVVLAGRDGHALERAARTFQGAHEPLCVSLDVGEDDQCAQAVETVVARFGRIDVLVNNAGIYAKGDVVSTSPELWARILQINLTGAFYMSRHVVPHMMRRRYGVVVNVASEAGLVGIRGQLAYNVSKAALIGLTRSLAVDLAPYGIRVNAVCPGTTWTPLVERAVQAESDPAAARRALEECRPLGRLGSPEEIAAAVCFLASDECGFATGAVLAVDGGYTAQ